MSRRQPLRCRWSVALTAALLVGLMGVGPTEPAAAQSEATGDCDERVWDMHLGRTALYTMLPVGRLTPASGIAPATTFTAGQAYVDEAGNEWLLFTDEANELHQPRWLDSQPDDEPYPNLKFVALEEGPDGPGSYEAILQPDGEDSYAASRTGTGAYTYGEGGSYNWLREGDLVGTYNFHDATKSRRLHFVWDVIPHYRVGGKNYAPPLFPVDPTGDWKTYRNRMVSTLNDLQKPGRAVVLAPNDEVASGWRIETTAGQKVRDVDADLLDAVRYIARCKDLLDCEQVVPTYAALANSDSLFGLREGEPVPLVDGSYEERLDGYTEVLTLLPDRFLLADLDGDCNQDVLTIFTWSGGASGVFYELIVLRNDGTTLTPGSRFLLGDRILLEGWALGADGLTINAVVQGPSDASCCPTVPETMMFSIAELLDGEGLGGPQVEAPVDGAPITHQDILAAIARDEPNIFYLGDCTGDNPVQSYPVPAGATPFCGTIVSSSGSEAVVDLAEEVGVVKLRFFNTDDGWRVDWDSAQ